MNTKAPRRLQQLRAQWVQWDAQLRGISAHVPRATRRWLVTAYLVSLAAYPPRRCYCRGVRPRWCGR